MPEGLVFIDPRDYGAGLSNILHAAREAAVAEIRSSLENPSSPLSFPAEWLLDVFNGGRTDSGIRVSELTALQASAVYACVNLISSTVGALPMHVYERMPASSHGRVGKRVAYDHALHDMLHDEPNPEMAAITFRKTLQVHMLLWGNGYAEIERDAFGRILALWPRNPASTRPRRDRKGQLYYETTDQLRERTDPNDIVPRQQLRLIHDDDMLHIPGLSLDGRLGQPTIWLARQVVGLSLATEKWGSKFFGNGARPGGVLEYPGIFKDDAARAKFRQSWHESQGGENAGLTAVLENGLKWSPMSVANNDSQFLETRQYQKTEVCSIYLVPPHMIGDTEKTNRANTEQIGIEFLNYTIAPWLESWQQESKRKLFPTTGRSANRFFPMFDTRRLTMPDAAARKDFYGSGRQWTYLCPNDVRDME